MQKKVYLDGGLPLRDCFILLHDFYSAPADCSDALKKLQTALNE